MNGPSTETEPSRGKGFVVAIDLKSVIIFVSLLSPLVALLTFGLQVRQDVRVNTMSMAAFRAELDSYQADTQAKMVAYETRIVALERAKLVFCAQVQNDTVRQQRELASIGC